MGEGEFSFVVLASGDGGYDTLFVNDIYNLPLKSDLVFLGACETGSGKWHPGEGIISLARGFFYAGAKSVVTTLWSINDESNKNLTARFFKNLKKGMQKDQALRQAQLEHLNTVAIDLYAHPVYWAAYTPVGNMEALSTGSLPWLYLMTSAGLAGIIFLITKRRRRSRLRVQ
jgi:CHAT domain-containing protein